MKHTSSLATSLTVTLGALLLSACAAPSSKFQNASGHVVDCSASGYGLLGAPAALAMHAECERKAQEAGYRPVNAASVTPRAASNPSSVRVAWPQDWQEKPISEAQVSTGVVASASNRTRDLTALVSVVSSDGISDRIAYVASRRANQVGRLGNATGSEIRSLVVEGKDALQYEVTGIAGGLSVSYLTTVVFAPQQIVYVATWTSTPNFETHKAELQSIASRVTGQL